MKKNSKQAVSHKGEDAALLLAVCLLLGACSSLPKGELSLDVGIKDRGVASWYGKEFDGQLAANGEPFDMTAYTAAHRKLPSGALSVSSIWRMESRYASGSPIGDLT
jgi:rare lipoprotein A